MSTQTRPLIQIIAAIVAARINCLKSDNGDWYIKYMERLHVIQKELLPSGSGIDRGTKINLDKSNADRIVLDTSFHHMDDNGFYCGWSDHTIVIHPTFTGIDITVTGRDKRNIKDYLADTYHQALVTNYNEFYNSNSWQIANTEGTKGFGHTE